MNGIMSPRGCRIFSVIAAALLFIHQDTPASRFHNERATKASRCLRGSIFLHEKCGNKRRGLKRRSACGVCTRDCRFKRSGIALLKPDLADYALTLAMEK